MKRGDPPRAANRLFLVSLPFGILFLVLDASWAEWLAIPWLLLSALGFLIILRWRFGNRSARRSS